MLGLGLAGWLMRGIRCLRARAGAGGAAREPGRAARDRPGVRGREGWNRRLLVAGLIELAAVAVLAIAPLGLVACWLVARWHLG